MKIHPPSILKYIATLACVTCLPLSISSSSFADPDNEAPVHARHHHPTNSHSTPHSNPSSHPVGHPQGGLQQTPHAISRPVNIPGVGKVTPGEINAGLVLVNNPTFQQMTTLLPPLLSSVSVDGNAQGNRAVIEDARNSLNHSNTPELVRKAGNSVLDFLYKDDPHAGLFNPHPNQRLQQFVTPAVGKGCMSNGSSVGLAVAAVGPQRSPAPGPQDGQVGFVFTSLGTGPAVFDAFHPLTVQWVNLETHRNGKVALTPNRLINATKGPGTFTAIAPTGHGRVVATISGTVSTRAANGSTISCTISPTLGLIRA